MSFSPRWDEDQAVPDRDVGPSKEAWRPSTGRKVRYDEGWRRAAACRQVALELFFPVGTTGTALEEIEEAKAVCGTCPVRSQCLEFALSTNQEFGVWGGHDEQERQMLRRRRRSVSRR